MEDYKYLFKVVLVGNAGVGKTCLVRKFTQGVFPPGQSATIGVDFMIKNVNVENDKIKLQIWDTAGQERFRSITQSYYRSAHAIVLVYDVACQPSFDCLPEWLGEIEHYANSRVQKILVGNKCDKSDEREIPEPIGQTFAGQNGFDYFLETSALQATNVEQLFNEVAAKLTIEMKQNEKKYVPSSQPPQDTGVISDLRKWWSKDTNSKSSSSCCGGGSGSAYKNYQTNPGAVPSSESWNGGSGGGFPSISSGRQNSLVYSQSAQPVSAT